MSLLRAALLLIGAILTCHAAESLWDLARWPDLVAQAKDRGVDYPAVVERAERGDKRPFTPFFLLHHTLTAQERLLMRRFCDASSSGSGIALSAGPCELSHATFVTA
jgi:hypothetical protein